MRKFSRNNKAGVYFAENLKDSINQKGVCASITTIAQDKFEDFFAISVTQCSDA